MKIVSAKVIVTCPGRNFVTLKIQTDQGVYGIGDATLNGRELAVVSYLEDHVVPCLIGMDPRRIEDIWQYLYRGAYWRRGPVTMRAVAAVDVALWDIKAKMAGMPLYDLLGGRSRDGVMVYGHANGSDIAETVDAVGHYIDLGYKAIRAQTGVPGVKDAYGVGRGKLFYEPADATLPSLTGWDTRKALEPYGLFWLEDVTQAENQEAFKLIRQHTTTPLAVGEIFNSIWDAKDLIQNQLIDYIRATIVGAGGVTHLRRIADLASLYQIRTGCHGATDLSPVTMGTALHFDTWVPNFGIQEYMRHTPETDAVFPHDYSFDAGFLHVGDTPGHGVDLDEAEAAKYPYKPAYLPVARLEDGTMWNW